MSWKKTVFLLLLLVLTAWFYYGKVRTQSSSGSFSAVSHEAPARSRVLPLDSGESIERLTLKDHLKQTEISLSQTADHIWQIDRPVQYPAESLVVDGLASLLRLTPRSRELSLEGREQTGLGFDKPRLEICVSTGSKPVERCLLIGSDAAVVKGGYAKWADESRYFLVNVNFLSAFDKTLYSLRKKQVFDLFGKEISEIQFRSPDKERVLKREGDHWTMSKPNEAGLSSDSVEALLTLIDGLYIKDFLDGETPDDSKFGLTSRQGEIRILFKDGSEQILIWGLEAPGFDAYYALGSENKIPLLISRGKISEVAEKFASFS